jgi:Xaa-Pro aminopeptidase
MTMRNDLYPAARVAEAAAAAGRAGLDVLLLTPGPDLRYVSGYEAHPSERLTCLAVPAAGDPFLVVPRLELRSATGSAGGRGGVDVAA